MSSDIDDDFGALKRAMEAATPRPDPARRAETLALAKRNFEATQGSLQTQRQSSERPKRWGVISGAIDMLMTRSGAAALTTTTALIAVGFLVMTPQMQEILWPPTDLDFSAQREVGPSIVPAPEAIAPTTADNDGAAVAVVAADEGPSEPMAEAEAPAVVVPAPLPMAPPVPQVGNFQGGFAETQGLTQPGTGNVGVVNQFGSGAANTAVGRGNGVATPPIGAIGNTSAGGGSFAIAPQADAILPAPEADTEEYANEDPSGIQITAEDPISTFSIDVDTASYALLRSALTRGQIPPADAIRIEEMINYFPYDYAAPEPGDISPFRPTVSVFQTPWNPDTQLVHIGLQGEMPLIEDRPPLNLVFLIDTSGSMNQADKLPLLIQSFRLMLDRLQPEDEVAIVTYAGSAGVALEPTPASDTDAIGAALDALQAGGSTNGVGGLEAAYALAEEMTGDGEVSRVLLATDGDFNVGLSDPSALEDYIAEQRDSGIYLSVLGFGRGNLQDDTMQALAQNGNGIAAFIDTLHEAQRVLVDQFAGALFPIADDVKVQVEFNPAVIAEYRLIGYETRELAREDFANDEVDAGELGAGHAVTAIYEVTPVGSPARLTSPLRYAEAEAETLVPAEVADEIGFISLRWKEPGEDESSLIDFPIPQTTAAGEDALFAAAIAGWGQLLRDDAFLGDWSYAEAIALAQANRGEDAFGYRFEAIQLMRLAQSLSRE